MDSWALVHIGLPPLLISLLHILYLGTVIAAAWREGGGESQCSWADTVVECDTEALL